MDMNFIFSWSTRYLTRSLRSLVRYRVDHSKIKFISTRGHVISSMVAVISLDLSKAFHCVPHELLLAKLKAYRVTEHGVALLRNYLSGRSQRVKVGDKFSSWLPVIRGRPFNS